MTESISPQLDHEPRLQGIKGWLILVAIGQVGGPLKSLADATAGFDEASYLANFAGGPALISYVKIVTWALTIAIFLTAFLFFMRKKAFPAAFCLVWLFSVLVTMSTIGLLAYVLDLSVFLILEELWKDAESRRTGILMAFQIPWLFYMWMSVRVKNTFVN